MTSAQQEAVQKSGTRIEPEATRETAGVAEEGTRQERPWLQLYPADVPACITYPDVSMGTLFDQPAPRFPTNDAFVFGGCHGTEWVPESGLITDIEPTNTRPAPLRFTTRARTSGWGGRI
jgi:hypothetical protein